MTAVAWFKRAVDTLVFGFLGFALVVCAAYGLEVVVGL